MYVVQHCLAIHTRGRISSERGADRTTTFPLQVLMSLSTFLENYIPVRIHTHTIFYALLSLAREKAGYVYTDGICTVLYTEKAGKCVFVYWAGEGIFLLGLQTFPIFSRRRTTACTYHVPSRKVEKNLRHSMRYIERREKAGKKGKKDLSQEMTQWATKKVSVI